MTGAAVAATERRRALPPELERAIVNVVLAVLPLAFTAFLLLGALRAHVIAQDFHESYYPAARRLIDGANPYAMTAGQIKHGMAFTYPPLSGGAARPVRAAWPLAQRPRLHARCACWPYRRRVWAAGVRDWRAYGLPLLWLPVIVGWQGGNVSLPILFLVALAWRWRDRPLRAGLVVAVAISLKTFAWPLALWLLVDAALAGWYLRARIGNRDQSGGLGDRRLRQDRVLPAGVGSSDRRSMAHRVQHARRRIASRPQSRGRRAASARRLGGHLAGPPASGLHRRHERQAMVLAVALMLVASPVVWSHYFVLLLVPLAITRPRFARSGCSRARCGSARRRRRRRGWQLALAWAVARGHCIAAALTDERPAGRRSADRQRPREAVQRRSALPVRRGEKGPGAAWAEC